MTNLVEGLTNEILRVTAIRDEYLKYPAGDFAATVMNAELEKAREAQSRASIEEMIIAYQSLKEFEL